MSDDEEEFDAYAAILQIRRGCTINIPRIPDEELKRYLTRKSHTTLTIRKIGENQYEIPSDDDNCTEPESESIVISLLDSDSENDEHVPRRPSSAARIYDERSDDDDASNENSLSVEVIKVIPKTERPASVALPEISPSGVQAENAIGTKQPTPKNSNNSEKSANDVPLFSNTNADTLLPSEPAKAAEIISNPETVRKNVCSPEQHKDLTGNATHLSVIIPRMDQPAEVVSSNVLVPKESDASVSREPIVLTLPRSNWPPRVTDIIQNTISSENNSNVKKNTAFSSQKSEILSMPSVISPNVIGVDGKNLTLSKLVDKNARKLPAESESKKNNRSSTRSPSSLDAVTLENNTTSSESVAGKSFISCLLEKDNPRKLPNESEPKKSDSLSMPSLSSLDDVALENNTTSSESVRGIPVKSSISCSLEKKNNLGELPAESVLKKGDSISMPSLSSSDNVALENNTTSSEYVSSPAVESPISCSLEKKNTLSINSPSTIALAEKDMSTKSTDDIPAVKSPKCRIRVRSMEDLRDKNHLGNSLLNIAPSDALICQEMENAVNNVVKQFQEKNIEHNITTIAILMKTLRQNKNAFETRKRNARKQTATWAVREMEVINHQHSESVKQTIEEIVELLNGCFGVIPNKYLIHQLFTFYDKILGPSKRQSNLSTFKEEFTEILERSKDFGVGDFLLKLPISEFAGIISNMHQMSEMNLLPKNATSISSVYRKRSIPNIPAPERSMAVSAHEVHEVPSTRSSNLESTSFSVISESFIRQCLNEPLHSIQTVPHVSSNNSLGNTSIANYSYGNKPLPSTEIPPLKTLNQQKNTVLNSINRNVSSEGHNATQHDNNVPAYLHSQELHSPFNEQVQQSFAKVPTEANTTFRTSPAAFIHRNSPCHQNPSPHYAPLPQRLQSYDHHLTSDSIPYSTSMQDSFLNSTRQVANNPTNQAHPMSNLPPYQMYPSSNPPPYHMRPAMNPPPYQAHSISNSSLLRTHPMSNSPLRQTHPYQTHSTASQRTNVEGISHFIVRAQQPTYNVNPRANFMARSNVALDDIHRQFGTVPNQLHYSAQRPNVIATNTLNFSSPIPTVINRNVEPVVSQERLMMAAHTSVVVRSSVDHIASTLPQPEQRANLLQPSRFPSTFVDNSTFTYNARDEIGSSNIPRNQWSTSTLPTVQPQPVGAVNSTMPPQVASSSNLIMNSSNIRFATRKEMPISMPATQSGLFPVPRSSPSVSLPVAQSSPPISVPIVQSSSSPSIEQIENSSRDPLVSLFKDGDWEAFLNGNSDIFPLSDKKDR